MTTTSALIPLVFVLIIWHLPEILAALRAAGIGIQWGEVVEGEARRWKREREAEPQPGRITGGHDTGVRFPRRMSEQDATDEEFLAYLNDDTTAEEIAPQIAGESADEREVDFSIVESYAKAELSIEAKEKEMAIIRRRVEEAKKKRK